MGHVRSNFPEVVATGPMLIKCSTSLGRPLLQGVFVPDHNCVTEEVDLTKGGYQNGCWSHVPVTPQVLRCVCCKTEGVAAISSCEHPSPPYGQR
jgi:hypothetical protein